MVEFAYHLGGILAIRNWPFYKGKCQKVGLICKALYFTFGAQLHYSIGAEGVADFVLRHGRQPHPGVGLNLRWGNE